MAKRYETLDGKALDVEEDGDLVLDCPVSPYQTYANAAALAAAGIIREVAPKPVTAQQLRHTALVATRDMPDGPLTGLAQAIITVAGQDVARLILEDLEAE